ncbi:MAG: carbohydrate kinase family protein [Candidatus Daviesbacteria bacterium]|nr:carbohydrate kinase family protein [Candidatus Daviesbacteria bacterium]
MFDLISLGDGAVDHFFKISDAHVEEEKSGDELCLTLGTKLPVETYQQILGGNNANNAVGATRLGLKTAIYLNIGEDLAGQFTLSKLKEEGVDSRYVVKNKGLDSNVSALISFKGERTILTYHQDFKYELPDLDKARWVYLSSMGKSAQNSHFMGQIENYLERTSGLLFYNPGTMELSRGLTKFPKLLSLTKVLILNLQEAELVLNIKPEEKKDIKHILKSLVNLGPRMAVVTDGVEGSYGYDGEDYWKLGIFPAKLIDMTGAGDSYATGLLAGIFYNNNLSEAMRWGAANGASVVEKIGPQAGLLSYQQIQEKLKEHSKITAQKLS